MSEPVDIVAEGRKISSRIQMTYQTSLDCQTVNRLCDEVIRLRAREDDSRSIVHNFVQTGILREKEVDRLRARVIELEDCIGIKHTTTQYPETFRVRGVLTRKLKKRDVK